MFLFCAHLHVPCHVTKAGADDTGGSCGHTGLSHFHNPRNKNTKKPKKVEEKAASKTQKDVKGALSLREHWHRLQVSISFARTEWLPTGSRGSRALYKTKQVKK